MSGELFQIRRQVDIEAELGDARDTDVEATAARLFDMPRPRVGAVGKAKRDIDRHCEHGCPVVAMVRHDDGDARRAVRGDVVECCRERQVRVGDDDSVQSLGTYPAATRVGSGVECSRVVDRRNPARLRPGDDFRRAGDDHCRPWCGGRDDSISHRARERKSFVVVEDGCETRLAVSERPQRNDDARVVRGDEWRVAGRVVGRAPSGHVLRMLPAVDAVYTVAKTAFYPWLRFGLRWTIEGEEHIPTHGPVLLASNHISYLDPLTLAYVADRRGRRVRYLAKAELFDKQPLGTLLHATHQIPVQRGTSDAVQALAAAIETVERGECIAVFPEGTISMDLEPMTGKSGTARLAQHTGVPVTPIALWGTHRILFKGRSPSWQWGVAETAVVGAPVTIDPNAHVRDATQQIMDAIRACLRRARELYPQRPSDGEDAWWWRDPEAMSGPRGAA
jgi:1-acyl-sn-glycerol-3-phosphate acyltransferase